MPRFGAANRLSRSPALLPCRARRSAGNPPTPFSLILRHPRKSGRFFPTSALRRLRLRFQFQFGIRFCLRLAFVLGLIRHGKKKRGESPGFRPAVLPTSQEPAVSRRSLRSKGRSHP